MKRFVGVLVVIVAIFSSLFFLSSSCGAASWELLAKASPDEWFCGVDDPNNIYPFDPLELPYPDDGQLKTNEAYVWGLTKYGDNIFFGTGQNILCLVLQGYLGWCDPVLTDDYVCEGCDTNPPYTKDLRSPGIYLYNKTQGLVRLNDSITTPPAFVASLEPGASLIETTVGIRSAGSHEGVAFLAGPGVMGVNIFAFDAETGAFLGATNLAGYSNVRKWLVGSDDNLYVGMAANETGGVVLRWTGDKEGELFAFETVATGLDGDAAELAEHDGRLFVNTWPGGIEADREMVTGGLPQRIPMAMPEQSLPVSSGVWRSPAIGTDGLRTGDEDSWEKLWSASDYDPDPVTAFTYGGGALASFDDWLYWGTMHVPLVAAEVHMELYGVELDEETIFGTWRAVSIFRGRNFGTDEEEIELLYGGSAIPDVESGYMMAYLGPDGTDPFSCSPGNRSWQTVMNKMGQEPLYGQEGFGNLFNNYTWTMGVFNGNLYVGTMDHKYLIEGIIGDIPPEYEIILNMISNADGADLYRFFSSSFPAQSVSLDGMGNSMNYGIRTMVSDNSLYLGTANPMNLNPDGGWELIELQPSASDDSSCFISTITGSHKN